jgi:nucleotide-binding universal stress UspA family protein
VDQARVTLRERPVRKDFTQATAETIEGRITAFAEPSSTIPGAYSGTPKSTEMRLRHILVPTDFSPASAKALECAVALANQCNATVSILHVIDINTEADLGSAEDLIQKLWENSSAQMAQLGWRLSSQVEAQTLLAEGLPWEVIVDKSREFDFLVLGQNRAATRRKVFSQHTAQRVIQNSSCPVIVVHAPA